MVFKTKIKCPICEGQARLSKSSIELFGGAISIKDSPTYECQKCGEQFGTGNLVDKTLEEAKKQFGFSRQIVSTGGSLAITIPPDLAKFYKLRKGEKIELVPAGEKMLKVKIC